MAQGLVEVIDDSKRGTGRRGPWVLYKVKVSGKWYSAGFTAPSFRVGETITFEVHNDGKGDNLKNAKVVGSGGGDTPPPPPPPPSDPHGMSLDDRIIMQHSQEMAERRIANLIAVNGLALSKADTKTGEAKRFEEVQEIARKLAVQFFNDAKTNRLLKFVADTPPTSKADAPVPTPKAKDADDDLGDDT